DYQAKQEAEAAKRAEAERIAKLEAENEALKSKIAESGRLPYAEKGVSIHKYGELRTFDNLDAGDQAVLVGVLEANKYGKGAKPPSDAAMKALAIKLEEDKSGIGEISRQAMK